MAKSRTNWDKISLKLVYEFTYKATFISLGANWGRFQNFVKQEFISTLSITWGWILPSIIVYLCDYPLWTCLILHIILHP